MKNRISVLFCIFVFAHVFAKAQKISFHSLTTENGLSQNTVLAIAQDAQGFMWFGTRHGLNRYDGYQFVNYINNPEDSFSISNNYITSLLYDSAFGLLIGTEDGLNKYDPQTNRFLAIPISKSNRATYVYALSRENDTSVWAACSSGLYLINPKRNTVTTAQQAGISDFTGIKFIRTLLNDSRGNLWISAPHKLIRINRQNGTNDTTTFFPDKNNDNSLSDDFITRIYEDGQKRIWIGTLNGLNLYNPDNDQFQRFSTNTTSKIISNTIRSITSETAGNIWVGTLNGLSIIDAQTYQCTSYQYNANDPESLNQNSIQSIFKDKDGSMWLGTFYGGVNIVYNSNISAPLISKKYVFPEISSNIISSIAINEKNDLFIGTEGGGLNYVNRLNNQIETFVNQPGKANSISSNLIKKIFIDKDNNVWIGTHGGGLNLFNSNDKTFKQVLKHLPFLEYRQSEIVALYEDSENIFWLGAHAGLYAFKRSGTTLTPALQQPLEPMKLVNVSAFCEDHNKNMWIGSLAGLYFFERQSGKVSKIPIKHHIQNINCITEDSRGNIWIGLSHGGLAMYDRKSNAIIQAEINDELSNNNILGILEDAQNNLWISTGNGLVKYNFQDKVLSTYTKGDGLPGNEFNYNAFLKDKSGEMFFGGVTGLISLFPNKIRDNKFAAPVVFTGLRVLGIPVHVNDESGILQKDINYIGNVELKHDQSTFTINFGLLSFIKSNKNIYTYRLREVHKDFIRTNIPSATFTNLAPGSYTLEVNGANNDGIWSYPRILKIKILPPFWATWWAYLLYILLISTILFFIVRFFYLRALLARDHQLHEFKLDFFTNVSHEIRTHLTLIQAPLERIESEHRQNPGLMRQLSHLKDNTNRLLQLVGELIDFRKAESNNMKLHVTQHDLISFLSSIYETFEDLAQSKNINISFVHNKKEVLLYFDNEQMGKVFYNLLTNAFKFTPNGGRIEVYVEDKENKTLVHITDNGKGIAPEYIDKLFTNFFQVNDHATQNTGYGIGLALSKAIVGQHKGTIAASSQPSTPEQEGRTCLTVSLQKGYSHFADKDISIRNVLNIEPAMDVALKEMEKEAFGPPDNMQRQQVLVVEDNDAIRELIRETLDKYYSITLCANGLQGWETAVQFIPDLIISDIMMPGMDGTLLTQKLKMDERTSHTPVILLTAKSTQADQIEGLRKGADVYLTKPFSVEVLKLSVKNLLAGREKMREKFSKEFIIAPRNVVIKSADEEFLNKLIGIIEEELDEPEFGVESLASKVAMSQSVLYKKLRAVTNMSVNEFIKSIRLKKAAQLLISKQYNVSEVSLMVGFYDRKYFSKEFKKIFGVTPSEYTYTQSEESS